MTNVSKHSKSFPQHIFLLGDGGTGKSTVGRLLAKELDIELGDTGLSSMRHKRMRFSHIIAIYGKEGYCNLLEQSLRKELQSEKKKIIVIYYQTIIKPSCQSLLKNNGTVFYLHSSPETLRTRKLKRKRQKSHIMKLWRLCKILYSKTYSIYLTTTKGKELVQQINPDIREKWAKGGRKRELFFKQQADHTIDTTHLTPEQVAMRIIRQVESVKAEQ